jgi:hypothetical protein
MFWYSNDRGGEARRLCTFAHHAHHSVLSQCHNSTDAAVSRHNGVLTFRSGDRLLVVEASLPR